MVSAAIPRGEEGADGRMTKIVKATVFEPGDEMDIHVDNIIHTEYRDGELGVWYYEVNNQ